MSDSRPDIGSHVAHPDSPPDSLAVDASGFAANAVRMASDDWSAIEAEVRLYWTLTDPESGPGDPLLLINGLGSPLVAFEPGFVAELVQRGFSVVRFDNRDVGRSGRVTETHTADGPPYAPPYALQDMAADAFAVLDSVGWETAHVLGQSMGGMIVQQMAIDDSSRLRSMTSLMSSTGERGFGQPTEEAFPALVKPSPKERTAWLDHRVKTEQLWCSPGSWDPEVTRSKAELLFDYGIDVDGTGRQFRAIMAGDSRDPKLAAIDVSTLVIHGSADTLIQPSGGRHTAEVIPGAHYVELEGFGHDLPKDYWPVLADTVAGFVAAMP